MGGLHHKVHPRLGAAVSVAVHLGGSGGVGRCGDGWGAEEVGGTSEGVERVDGAVGVEVRSGECEEALPVGARFLQIGFVGDLCG